MSIQPIFNNMASGNTRVIFVPRLATGPNVRSQINAMWGIDISQDPRNPVRGTEGAGGPFQTFLDLLHADPRGDFFDAQAPKSLYASNGTPTEIMIWFNIQIDGLFLIKKSDGATFFCDYKTAISEDFFDRTNDDLVIPVTGSFRSMLTSTTISTAAGRLKEEANRYKRLSRDLQTQLAAATEQKAKADEAFRNATEDAKRELGVEAPPDFFDDADEYLKRQNKTLKLQKKELEHQVAILEERDAQAEAQDAFSSTDREQYEFFKRSHPMMRVNLDRMERELATKQSELATKQSELSTTQSYLATKTQVVHTLRQTLAAAEVVRKSENEFAAGRIRDLEQKNELLRIRLQEYESSRRLLSAGNAGQGYNPWPTKKRKGP